MWNCIRGLLEQTIKRREVFKGGINCILIIDLFVLFFSEEPGSLPKNLINTFHRVHDQL